MRSTVGFRDLQIDQQGRDGLGAHAGTAIGVQGQGAWDDVLFRDGVGDQLFGERGRLAQREHPPDDIATEDIEDDVEVITSPLRGPLELGDIPRPHLVGPGGEELGLGLHRVSALITPLTDLVVGG